MKKLVVYTSTLLFLSMNAFAEPHLDEAIKHATAASQAGDAAGVVEHSLPALEHAMSSALNAKGVTKTHTDEAIKALEKAIDFGKNKKSQDATASAQDAVEHLKTANKK